MAHNDPGRLLALGAGAEIGSDAQDQFKSVAAARDSMTVAGWTIASRATGVLRFAVIGAVLGPTFFGNTYQFTNSLPNLIYYGFLAFFFQAEDGIRDVAVTGVQTCALPI